MVGNSWREENTAAGKEEMREGNEKDRGDCRTCLNSVLQFILYFTNEIMLIHWLISALPGVRVVSDVLMLWVRVTLTQLYFHYKSCNSCYMLKSLYGNNYSLKIIIRRIVHCLEGRLPWQRQYNV